MEAFNYSKRKDDGCGRLKVNSICIRIEKSMPNEKEKKKEGFH